MFWCFFCRTLRTVFASCSSIAVQVSTLDSSQSNGTAQFASNFTLFAEIPSDGDHFSPGENIGQTLTTRTSRKTRQMNGERRLVVMSRSASWLIAASAFAGLLLLSAPRSADAVHCYVCSWSPNDQNRVDTCTRSNFSTTARTLKCDVGCETVTVFDKNGRLDFFYRNCAANTTTITGTCHNETSRAITKEICTCDSDYCNRSTALELNSLGVFLSVLFALLFMKQH